MNSLHGIKISNDERAVKGQTLHWHAKKKMLSLKGKVLTPAFLNRRTAGDWAKSHGATIAAV